MGRHSQIWGWKIQSGQEKKEIVATMGRRSQIWGWKIQSGQEQKEKCPKSKTVDWKDYQKQPEEEDNISKCRSYNQIQDWKGGCIYITVFVSPMFNLLK